MDYRPIIESKYNRQNWQTLLYDIFRNKVQFWQQPQPVDVDRDRDMAKNALYTGKITLPDGHIIAIYEVELSDSVVIERNRAGIRNLLLSSWRNMGCAGAFMFCFRQNEAILRFSYVSESFAFAEDGSLTKESTDTKRFTYLLGEGHRSRTAIMQFEELKKSALDLKAITKAFSVEALSDMFFDEYKKQYEDIIEFITGKRFVKVGNKWEEKVTCEPCKQIMDEFRQFPDAEKAVRDYVKKLMGRLVFIQFLQKKGWMGCPVGEAWTGGDKEFVQTLFANTNLKDTFVDDVLEPLFNDINTRREGDLAGSPNVGVNIKIPYLNGGLFEEDDYDKTAFPLPAKYMENMLDFFASYNFTIDENDPNDAEIGVDPEMLGHIFENLLEDNKDKGAFYTPKEIVRYMCQESLIAYLENETSIAKDKIRQFVLSPETGVNGIPDNKRAKLLTALKEVKICDPAIGSGAFPMGLLNELLRCREALDTETGNRTEIKKSIIQNNIYGVDIEKGAVDIARLRFWLSIIVDEDQITPLPNLDYKIMQGNSLLECFNGLDLSKLTCDKEVPKGVVARLPFDDEKNILQKEVFALLSDYYSCCDLTWKTELQSKIADAINKQLEVQGYNTEILKQLKKINLAGNPEFFLWHTWFNDVFRREGKEGFDIVIGNPPYIKEYENRSAFDGFREQSPYYLGKMDLWYGFACFGVDLLRSDGVLAFIATNNWTTNTGAKKLRNKVVGDTQILQMVDFGSYMIFENASIQTMVMLFRKNNTSQTYSFDYRRLNKERADKNDVIGLFKHEAQEATYLTPQMDRSKMQDAVLTFTDAARDTVLNKMQEGAMYLNESDATNGIHPHYDFVNNKIARKHPFTKVGDGIFGLSEQEKNTLHLDDKELELVKPYYTTEEIHRYYTNPKNKLWLIYTVSSFKALDSMDAYPHLKAHLDKYKTVITSSNKPYGLHRAREERFFKGEKIVCQRKCVGHPSFSYSDFDTYVSATFYVIKTSRFDLKFLTGLFNSKLVAFWLRHRGKMQGDNFQVDKEPLMSIPIPQATETEQLAIASLVTNIIAEKRDYPNADTSSDERKIDFLVYKLYGLTYDEVLIVDPETNITEEEYGR